MPHGSSISQVQLLSQGSNTLPKSPFGFAFFVHCMLTLVPTFPTVRLKCIRELNCSDPEIAESKQLDGTCLKYVQLDSATKTLVAAWLHDRAKTVTLVKNYEQMFQRSPKAHAMGKTSSGTFWGLNIIIIPPTIFLSLRNAY